MNTHTLVCSSSQLAPRIGLYTASLVSLTDVLIGWCASDCDAPTHIVTYPNKHGEYPPSPTWRASPTWRKQKAFPLPVEKAGILFHSYPTWAYTFTIWNIFTSGNLKHEQKSKIITAPYEIMVTWPQPCHVTRRWLRAKPRQVSSVPLLSLLGTHGLYLRCFVVSVIRQNCVVCFDQFWLVFFAFLCVDRGCLTGRLSPSCRTLMTTQTCWNAWETQVTIVNLGFDLRRKMPLGRGEWWG